MSDLIKREDAIKAINKALDRETLLNRLVRKVVLNAIISVPSADRPQGYWINDDGAFRCTICGEREDAFIDGWDWEVCGTSKFCPSCGARMKGADDEN